MAKKKLRDLLQSYLSGNCTPEDQIQLAHIIREIKDDALNNELRTLWDQQEITHKLSDKKAARILSCIQKGNTPQKTFTAHQSKKRRYIRTIGIAASILLILGGIGFRGLKSYNETPIIIKKEIIAYNQPTPYARHIILSDSSRIILEANSTLAISRDFNQDTRTVELKGEAYFDISHNPAKPFIINSGELKTTVLGTAFNIRAWPKDKQISIVVTRGKVMVQSLQKTLALLTKNQEITYNKEDKASDKESKVEAKKIVTDWTKKEMDFNAINLENIIKAISKRYQKTIIIKNRALAQNKLVVSFNGTETLENVLSTLCQITDNAQYKVENDDIIIY